MMEREDQSPGGAEDEGDCCSWMDHPLGCGKGRDGDKKRRFSEEQIKSLESMFETQTKLEPRQKLQLARDLGLQPRQVAIWFQNKRARWKSKQLEREYNSLRADYDALLSSYESLKKEKQSLVKQLQNLSELVEKPVERNTRESECNNKGDDDCEKQKPSLSLKQDSDLKLALYSDDDHKKLSYFSEEEAELYSGQPTSLSLTSSAEQQFCFQSPSWPTDHSSSNTQWWEFWPMNE